MKSVLICRCVCKDWNILFSDLNFAKLLFTRTLPATMIRPFRSRIFRLVEYDPIEWHERRNNPCCCRVFDVLNHSSSSIKLDPKFEIPLPGPKSLKGRELYIEVLPCNGLFYLSGPEYRNISLVCNPITGEFIRLPKIPPLLKHCKQIHWGFGFHPKTNQYKLTGTYLNGALHWIGVDVDGNVLIWGFNFDTEKFQTFSVAPMDPDTKVILFEFRDSLCLLYSNELLGTMWRMERYGVGESWTPIFQHSASSTSQLHGCIAYHDPENQEFRILLTTPWYDDHFQIVHHVPSLIRLKDIIMGDNVLVQNIYS
ncbi:hypothetical protein Ahy_A07g031397 [Arachis hypogaea]|uniref:F-box associated beta-propeller type 3 domain-containing protein n=1 Tax=Arachis hypogaea TaxID=3818 RepID=A0A445C3T9_ARAHY|nr:hypothetical protein Ahy_A07g031397 [Arachis hypogaea]